MAPDPRLVKLIKSLETLNVESVAQRSRESEESIPEVLVAAVMHRCQVEQWHLCQRDKLQHPSSALVVAVPSWGWCS